LGTASGDIGAVRFAGAQAFFEADRVATEEAPERAAAGGDALLAGQGVNLIKRQIGLLGDQSKQGHSMLIELGPAPSRRLDGHAPRSLNRWNHLTAELTLTPKRSAAARRVAPDETAPTTRRRKSSDKAFGIDLLPLRRTKNR